MIIPKQQDCLCQDGFYYLDGKRFNGYFGIEYLVKQGFNRKEAIDYLLTLEWQQ